jgi:hypothetical protein
VSAGPGDGDLAVSGADAVYVVLGGRLAATIPMAQGARWVPGGDWLVYARTGAPTIQGVRGVGHRVAQAKAGRGATWDLPSCARQPQPLPGPAVAFVCRGVLEIAPLGASGLGTPTTFPWTARLGGGRAAPRLKVDPSRRLVAATNSQGWITVYRLAGGQPLPGVFMAAAPNGPAGLAWSPSGDVLAVSWPAGFALWRPGTQVVMVPAAAYDDVIRWLPGGAALVAASSFSPAKAPAGHRVALDGSSRVVIPPSTGPVLAISADGLYAWRAAAPSAATGAPASSAAAPDRLVAQPMA